MTYGNETNPDQEKIEAAFEMLVSAQNAVSHVMTHNSMRDHISMRDLLRIAKGPKNDADHTLLLRVNDDFMARRQLRAILQSQSLICLLDVVPFDTLGGYLSTGMFVNDSSVMPVVTY